jgi:hypothetical protein
MRVEYITACWHVSELSVKQSSSPRARKAAMGFPILRARYAIASGVVEQA